MMMGMQQAAPVLSVQLADKQGLQWAQAQVKAHHYLHAPVDPRCSPVAYLVILLGEPAGCLIFGRPEATRVLGWYGSVEDVRRGTCPLTRWEVLNLARVWLDPRLQRAGVAGTFLYPQGMIGPSILPGFYDRHRQWRPAAASYLVEQALEQVVRDYLLVKPPVWLEEPYGIQHILSYCNTCRHSGTLYRAAGFEQVRINAKGIATYRKQVRALTSEEHTAIAKRSWEDPRCRRLRVARSASAYQQLHLEDMYSLCTE